MHEVVTGVAGFIGSRLARELLAQGRSVVGVDCFLDAYPRQVKEDRLADLWQCENFKFVEGRIEETDLRPIVKGAQHVYHLAAQAGVRTSWGQRFADYVDSNVLALQKLLEAVREEPISRFVFSSSSSVYGETHLLPTSEEAPLQPASPYGVSKLMGEHLCRVYGENFGVPTVALRYFTVYGPKPRPDQAVCIFTRALLEGREIEVYGDGEQLRGMTYVDDVVRANLLAAAAPDSGGVFNIGGGHSVSVNQLIGMLEVATGKRAAVRYGGACRGDVRDTCADIRRARRLLDWAPATDLEEGLAATVESVAEYYCPEAMWSTALAASA